MKSLDGDELMQLTLKSLFLQFARIGEIENLNAFWHHADGDRLLGLELWITEFQNHQMGMRH